VKVLHTVKRAYDIYFERVRGGKVNRDRRKAVLEAYSCIYKKERKFRNRRGRIIDSIKCKRTPMTCQK
jgi:hypothetical protein